LKILHPQIRDSNEWFQNVYCAQQVLKTMSSKNKFTDYVNFINSWKTKLNLQEVRTLPKNSAGIGPQFHYLLTEHEDVQHIQELRRNTKCPRNEVYKNGFTHYTVKK